MKDDYLADVEWYVRELDRILEACRQEIDELEQFRRGRRKSRLPLGSKFLTNRGRELDELRQALEWKLGGYDA